MGIGQDFLDIQCIPLYGNLEMPNLQTKIYNAIKLTRKKENTK